MHAVRGTIPLLLTALVLGAGCGSPQETGSAPQPAPSAASSPPADPPDEPPDESPDEPTHTQLPSEDPSDQPSDEPALSCVAGVTEVAGAQDPDAAMDAFCTVAELVRREVLSRAFLPGEPPVTEDYAGVEPFLTDAARRRWDEAVTAWVERRAGWAGDLLSALVLHDATRQVPDGYVIDPDGPYAFETSVAAPRASSGESGGLSLRVTVTSHLVLDEQGDDTDRHSLLPVTREATYTLVRGGPADGWLLDDWQARDSYGEVRLVAG